jgi:RND family efflux transporter MFP subunit
MFRTRTMALWGGAFLAVCMIVFISAGTDRADPSTLAAAAQPGTDQRGTGAAQAQLAGTVVAAEAAEVVATTDGLVQTIHVGLGDKVKAGGPLITLDTRRLRGDRDAARAVLAAAESQVAKAKVDLDQAAREATRSQKLTKAGVVPGEEVIKTRYTHRLAVVALRTARAQRDQQRVVLKQLEISLAESVIRAPFDAVVTGRFIERGERVTTGTKVMKVLSSATPFVRFAIPAERKGEFPRGSRLSVSIAPDGTISKAIIERLAPAVDPESGLIFAEARFLGAVTLDAIKPGSLAYVRPEPTVAAGPETRQPPRK